MLALLQRSRAQEPYGANEWLSLLNAELDPSALDQFKAMDADDVIIPATDRLAPDFKLVRHDQEVLDLGFNDSSYKTRVVSGLRAGSRVAEAGLKEGDEIWKSTFIWASAGRFRAQYEAAGEEGGNREADG